MQDVDRTSPCCRSIQCTEEIAEEMRENKNVQFEGLVRVKTSSEDGAQSAEDSDSEEKMSSYVDAQERGRCGMGTPKHNMVGRMIQLLYTR